MRRLLFLLYCAIATATVSRKQDTHSDITKFTIQMIGYSPERNDDYVAVSRQAIEGYIVGFEPLANADRIHHILLFGCTEPAHATGFWKGGEVCSGTTHILYAWAKNAPSLDLPNNVGFSIGHESDNIRHLVMQVHYAQPFAGDVKDFSGVTLHITQKQPQNLAAVLLFVSGESIPPGKSQVQINVSCEYGGTTEMHPFAFRTHAHAMGRVISAFYKHEGQWTKIGVRNPQWPQLFEKITTSPVIRKGDLMAATCRFDSHDKTKPVAMGSMGVNEMCNFYMMFYWDASKENPFPYGGVCNAQQRKEEMIAEYPKEGTQLLPSRPDLEHHAAQSKYPFGVVEMGAITEVDGVKLGQVAGLTFSDGNVVIFHRAGRNWDQNTFDQYNVLLDKTPIKDDVIVIAAFNENKAHMVKKLGKNKFYLPHGIHFGKDGFLYTTDVGAHTVAKWKINGNELKLVWEVGQRHVPGSDKNHFCKPAGIVLTDEGVFVADGYCNNRIVQLDSDTGSRKSEFGLPGNDPSQFNLPHDIVSTPAGGHLLVADRENGRVQELSIHGDFIMEWASSLFSNIYSVDAQDEYVYMVPGRASGSTNGIYVFVGRAGTGLVEFGFAPTSRPFGQPHVLRVSPDGHNIFVGDIAQGQPTLWIFRIQHDGATLTTHGSSFSGAFRAASEAPGATGILVSLAFAVLVVGFVVIRRRRLASTRGHANFDKKGFKPLRTEETVGFISDGSETE